MIIKNFIDKYINLMIGIVVTLIVVLITIGGILLITSRPPETKDLRATFVSDNPIVKQLPYQHPYYSINYKTVGETTNDIIITIRTPSPRYRYSAVEKLKSWGYDPTDYSIEFIDYKNPLEK